MQCARVCCPARTAAAIKGCACVCSGVSNDGVEQHPHECQNPKVSHRGNQCSSLLLMFWLMGV